MPTKVLNLFLALLVPVCSLCAEFDHSGLAARKQITTGTLDTRQRELLSRSSLPRLSAEETETFAIISELLWRSELPDGTSLLDKVERVELICGPDPSGKPGGKDYNRVFVIFSDGGIRAIRDHAQRLRLWRRSHDLVIPRSLFNWKRAHAPFSATLETKHGVPGWLTTALLSVSRQVFRRRSGLPAGPGGQMQYFRTDRQAIAFTRGGHRFAANPRLVEIDLDILLPGGLSHASCLPCSYRTARGPMTGADLFALRFPR